MRRCFIAIDIPAANSILKLFQLLKKEFADSAINWVKPENIHLTLAFLGEIQDNQVEMTILELDEISRRFDSFNCNLYGFGSFGSRENPKVLRIGIKHLKPYMNSRQGLMKD